MKSTADVLAILDVISITSSHGYGVARHLVKDGRLSAEGMVYPALHRIEQAGWITGRWRTSEARRARYYSLTPAGRRVLERSKIRSTRRRPVSATASVLVCSVVATVSAAQDPTLPRVRSSSPSIRALLSRGGSDSSTFRRLVETIEHTNGIVYVEDGHCGHGVHACVLLSVTPAGGFRFLTILINAGASGHAHPNDLIATIGHELRHAIEVLSDAHVTNASQMYAMYMNEAASNDGHFETAAAISAGDQIALELSKGHGSRDPDGRQAFVAGSH